MIRKCFKLNTCFVEIVKNSTALHTFDQKWIVGNPNRLASVTSFNHNPFSFDPNINKTSKVINRPITFPKLRFNRNERGDADCQNLDENDAVVLETPVKTELFEMRGPNNSAFLIEVQAKDLGEVKEKLMELKGEYFRFDKTAIEWFTIKCILRVETPFVFYSVSDQVRLSKVHAISSGCDEVYNGEGKFFFVSSIDRMSRVKRILQKFGYIVLEILHRFQPGEIISLDENTQKICIEFVRSVENLPKVISVTHNLKFR